MGKDLMTKLCLDDNCYNMTKQLAKKLQFLSHVKGYLEDANKCDSEGLPNPFRAFIADEEKHAEILRNQLALELKNSSFLFSNITDAKSTIKLLYWH